MPEWAVQESSEPVVTATNSTFVMIITIETTRACVKNNRGRSSKEERSSRRDYGL